MSIRLSINSFEVCCEESQQHNYHWRKSNSNNCFYILWNYDIKCGVATQGKGILFPNDQTSASVLDLFPFPGFSLNKQESMCWPFAHGRKGTIAYTETVSIAWWNDPRKDFKENCLHIVLLREMSSGDWGKIVLEYARTLQYRLVCSMET